MKRDKLNFSKSYASVIKTTLLTILLAGCMNVIADDSRTPMVRLNKLASLNKCEKANLQNFAARIEKLFSNFFDLNNTLPYAEHKAYFLHFLNDLDCYLKITTLDKNKSAYKEIELMARTLAQFIQKLDEKAQIILKKGSPATYADIMPLSGSLMTFSHLVPDAYIGAKLVTAIKHRLNC